MNSFTPIRIDGRIGHQMDTRFGFQDDFFKVNDEDWLITGDSGAAVAQSNDAGFQKGGWAEFVSGATDNDEAYFTTGAWYKCEVGKKLTLSGRAAVTEAATNAANWCFGFINAGAANVLIDTGGGPIVAADKAMFYKIEGTLEVRCVTAKTTGTGTNVRTSTGLRTVTSGEICTYDIVFEPPKISGGVGIFHYFINGVEVATHPVTTGTATSTITAQPTAQLTPIIGIKAGTGAAQNFHLDYLAVYADR